MVMLSIMSMSMPNSLVVKLGHIISGPQEFLCINLTECYVYMHVYFCMIMSQSPRCTNLQSLFLVVHNHVLKCCFFHFQTVIHGQLAQPDKNRAGDGFLILHANQELIALANKQLGREMAKKMTKRMSVIEGLVRSRVMHYRTP